MSEKKITELAESLLDFCNALESLAVNLRRQISELTKTEAKVTVPEERFNVLKWQDEQCSRLGNYQVAYQSHNLPENWSHAFNILKANSSLIANRFHEANYVYAYWIYLEKYEDRIFRKKLEEAKG